MEEVEGGIGEDVEILGRWLGMGMGMLCMYV